MKIINGKSNLYNHIRDYRLSLDDNDILQFFNNNQGHYSDLIFGKKYIIQELKDGKISKPRVAIYHFTGLLDMAVEYVFIEEFKEYYHNYLCTYTHNNNEIECNMLDLYSSTRSIVWMNNSILIKEYSIENFKELYRKHLTRNKN